MEYSFCYFRKRGENAVKVPTNSSKVYVEDTKNVGNVIIVLRVGVRI